MQLCELLFRWRVLFGSCNHLCVCSPPYREHRKAQLSTKEYQTRCQIIWLYSFAQHKRRGKEQKEAQGTGSKLHAGEAECKRMRFPVILGARSGGAAELNGKTKWLPTSRLFPVLFWNWAGIPSGVAYCCLQFFQMHQLRQTIASLYCRA